MGGFFAFLGQFSAFVVFGMLAAFSTICGIEIATTATAADAAKPVGVRPYELDWAGRTQDLYPPLVDFEKGSTWSTQAQNASVTYGPSREQLLWGQQVGKLSYRATTDKRGEAHFGPTKPVPITQPWDAFSVWIWGNSLPNSPEAKKPIYLSVVFQVPAKDNQGDSTKPESVEISLDSIVWKEWFVVYRVLTPEERSQLAGASFVGFHISNIQNEEERVLYFDNFAVLEDSQEKLTIPARPKRGIPMLADAGSGINTGEGTLPFPTRKETILPTNLAQSSTSTIRQDGSDFLFEYSGEDGKLTYRLHPESGTWSDLSGRWGEGDWFFPTRDGGIRLWDETGDKNNGTGSAVLPEKLQHQGTQIEGDAVVSTWLATLGEQSQTVSYHYRLWGKSLVIDTIAKGGRVAEVRYGGAEGIAAPELVWLPYMSYNRLDDRPGVVVMGDDDHPLFLAGNTDWYLSNASELFGERTVQDQLVHYQGGVRYHPKTDGQRNDCYERFFLTIAPQFEEVMPNIPNPVSPWKKETATRVWTVLGAPADRASNKAYFDRLHRYGIRHLAITDHETMWRDGEESFTFRTKTAPAKGGDASQAEYTRYLQDQLGYLYGPYNNFTDFAPVNEFWTPDLISRNSHNQLMRAWRRCYAPKPALAVQFAEKLPPLIQEKFHFGTAYCDVHTAVSPWSRTDYDARVPGGGTFAATFYAYGEIMLLQKKAWNGPVYSEGRHQWFYSGLTDGNYGQDPDGELYRNPWLVDFSLRKMHPLNNDFGMGSPSMLWGRDNTPETAEEYDLFFAAEIAFGHTGFLIGMGSDPTLTLRSYYMPLPLHSRYAQSEIKTIRYADDAGTLHDTSRAVATGIYADSRIVNEYRDGTVTVVNGSGEKPMHIRYRDRDIQLPPYGYTGWSADGKAYVFSGDVDGHRIDYAESEDYLYMDGRGRFTRMDKAATQGPAICRKVTDKEFEIIPVGGTPCGFAIQIDSAEAFDEEGKSLGPASVRSARGLSYVQPVEGAFRYLAKGSSTPPQNKYDDLSPYAVPGQDIPLSDGKNTVVTIPSDAQPDTHYWTEIAEGEWLDFQIRKPVAANLSIHEDKLRVALTSYAPSRTEVQLSTEGQTKKLALDPKQSQEIDFALPQLPDDKGHLLEATLDSTHPPFQETLRKVLYGTHAARPVATHLSPYWAAGVHSQGEDEIPFATDIGASVARSFNIRCGDLSKEGIAMHPPYKNGKSGSVFLEYQPILLPETPIAFRAQVGKQDGSDRGDGIHYRVEVIADGQTAVAAGQHVIEHEWRDIVADLSPWAGKKVALRLVTDPGPAKNTSGDWAAWAEMGLFELQETWTYRLDDQIGPYLREPGPHPARTVTPEILRSAARAWLRYEGLGISGGTGQYGSNAIVNDILIGPMAPASGSETRGEWGEGKVALTSEAIATLTVKGNRFQLDNHGHDSLAIQRVWLELEFADGSKASSQISPTPYTQPKEWIYGTGLRVPFDEKITIEIDF